MAVNPKHPEADAAAGFDLKAANFMLPVICLLNANIEALAAKLSEKVETAPEFFHHTPVVIDLSGLPEGVGETEFPLLVGLLRGYGMIPFGVRGGNPAQNAIAEALDLAILRDSYARKTRTADAATPADPAAAAVILSSTTQSDSSPGATTVRRVNAGFMLVTRPVRSGQRVYAAGGDLSITAAVSSGAELMADGNIHIYGPLRGRALAGMNGNLDARIFCLDLQAELVSIAGHYRVSEHIPKELRGVPVQIFLDQKILRIEKI